ncbi:MAG TPA: carboxypeptidase-like regulatory domain-containing protein, partial [Candidatus Angelobacter sp.]|nr:carboxypeptidase-like regulatory domain-containing protein [Candidatus Angelobacter sp.]
MKPTAWGRVWLLLLGSVLWSAAAFGQTTGEIRGGVVDPSGAIVQGATVTIVMTGTGATRVVTSEKDG